MIGYARNFACVFDEKSIGRPDCCNHITVEIVHIHHTVFARTDKV